MSGIKFEDKNPSGGSGRSGQGATVQFVIMEAVRSLLNRMLNPFRVSLPEHHFSPDGADTFDIRVIGIIDPNAEETLMSYTAKESQTIRFIRYGIYTNILLATNVEFYPTKDGSRILRYHGDPNDDFRLNCSIGTDLTENAMIPCDVTLQAGQKLEWKVKNNGLTKADIGVRMRGYLVNENKNGTRGFGG
jgi:hypothetical protein